MTRYFVLMVGTTGIMGQRDFGSMSERAAWITEAQKIGCRVIREWQETGAEA